MNTADAIARSIEKPDGSDDVVHATAGPRGRPIILLVAGILLATASLVLPHALAGYQVFQLSMAIIWALAALGLNLLTGYTGVVSVGHSAFFAVGAYTTGVLMAVGGWHYLPALVAGGAASGVCGALVGGAAWRVRGLYFALVTFAVAAVVPPVAKRIDVTGGPQGLLVPRVRSPAVLGVSDEVWIYYIVLVVATVLFVGARNLVRGQTGRVIVAVRDNEISAAAVGGSIGRLKTIMFGYSALFTGFAGSLYALAVGFLAPDAFGILLGISLVAAIVVGGLGTLGGALIGGFVLQYLPFYAGEIHRALTGLLFGAALIVIIMFFPSGIMGGLRGVFARLSPLVLSGWRYIEGSVRAKS